MKIKRCVWMVLVLVAFSAMATAAVQTVVSTDFGAANVAVATVTDLDAVTTGPASWSASKQFGFSALRLDAGGTDAGYYVDVKGVANLVGDNVALTADSALDFTSLKKIVTFDYTHARTAGVGVKVITAEGLDSLGNRIFAITIDQAGAVRTPTYWDGSAMQTYTGVTVNIGSNGTAAYLPANMTTFAITLDGTTVTYLADGVTVTATTTSTDFKTLRFTFDTIKTYNGFWIDNILFQGDDGLGGNSAPNVDAGSDATVYLADGGVLALDAAYVTDDGEPNDPVEGYVLTTEWTSDPAAGVSFDDASLVNATATFTEIGTYVLTLTADDTELQDSDSITVTVEEKLLPSIAVISVDDAFTAKNTPDINDGARNAFQMRDPSASWARNAYLKFDTGVIPGNFRYATLQLTVFGTGRNTIVSTDTAYAVTYGPGGEWFEGNGDTTASTPDTTGVGITWNNDDLVWGEELGSLTSTFVGNSHYTFNLSNLVIESDGKTTIGMGCDLVTSSAQWKSKETGTAADRPLLTVYYDPEQAVEVSPVDETSGVHPGASLIWQEAVGATAHEVYFGTTSGALAEQTVPAVVQISTDPNLFSWTPAAELALGLEYFWRIDEVIGGETFEGEEWSFTVAAVHPDIPSLVSPANGNDGSVDPIDLVWNEGFAADSHDVYLSTDYALVAALDDSVKIADVTSPLEVTNLDLETEYFWTVQATAASGGPWPSVDVYSFTTNDFAALDGFNDGVSWVETPGTGADVNDFVIGAALVMEFIYDDAGDVVSEASLTFAEAKDLTADTGREALTMFIYGLTDNAQEDMYVALSDGVTTVQAPVLFDGEPVELTLPLYKESTFVQTDLDDFAPVDLSAVTSIAIGFGDGVSEGKSGTVYIDNVNVRTRRCISLFVDGDIVDADCIAGPNDLALIASDWLDAETVVTATAASTDGLIVQFDFEEAVDSNSVTSSVTYDGVNYATATVVDTPILGVAGYTGNAIDMASAGNVTIDDSAVVLASLADEITVSLWCYGNITDLTGIEVYKARAFRAYTSVSTIALDAVMPNETGDVIFGSTHMGGSWMSWNDSTPADWTGAWNHYAFVLDAANDLQAIYCNGVMVARDNDDVTGYTFDLTNLDRFDIGVTPAYHGKIDDFRIYNRALDASEIVDLAGKTSVTQSSLSNADIDDDGTVNLIDFAEVASIWLTDEILWP